MKKIFSIAVICAMAMAANAVPAKRGWQTRTQADGTTIEVQVIGDEFYHYTINRDGLRVRLNADGMYEVVGEAPTVAQVRARRAEGQVRRQRKDVGTKPNLAPKGIVILANFKDTKMQSSHTQAVFDELCNSKNCTVNSGYPSAGQYFADQSDGKYRPQFDVFGPVTLSNNYAYYGKDKSEEGDDQYATSAVVEACILANEQFSELNFADYDSDNDGYVDFVYVIYAGKGQADGGDANTIWPHNWDVTSAIQYGYCTYTDSQRKIDGKKVDNYAMSSELSGSALGGIGTLCHEFGHVMGLPDLYDIEYGTVYDKSVTPNDWDIMDGGSYNADGHCPPNYDPWEKYFFGWVIPINPGPRGQKLDLIANGQKGYNPYQLNASGKQQAVTSTGVCYYIENRQAQGWDKPLTGHGMLIWKVNFNESAWTNNAPNGSSTSGAPLYTVVSATGTKIGWDGTNDNCPKNPFPGSGKVTEWKGLSGKPLLDITESNGVISLIYIEDAGYNVTWVVNGAELEKVEYEEGDDLKLPTKTVTPCDGTKFIGWTEEAEWMDPFVEPSDLFTTADGKKVTKAVTYYAVFQ
ncbi:MAG: M6 family metalloprotease domain-containing protein [Paludibacteraceae bacterium]|nr:M6 family metalloprotease domain-containing protein [Paludibacteraceae bacterium]